MTDVTKKKVAVLGGGVGAMVAAFELTGQPGWQERYDITVYQMGWRLGGKGASGRNRDRCHRIEEHGLHIWMGFYQNAFRLIRDCYKELGRKPTEPLATWREAFQPQNQVIVMEEVEGNWVPWVLDFPDNPEAPGDGGVFLKPWDYVKELLRWLVGKHDEPMPPGAPPLSPPGRLVSWVEEIVKATATRVETILGTVIETVETAVEVVTRTVETAASAPADGPLHQAKNLAECLPEDPHQHTAADHFALGHLLEHFLAHPVRATEHELWKNDGFRHRCILLALAGTIAYGLVVDGVIFHGFDVIDKYDLREWLQRHGLTDPQFYWSAPVRALYDLVFGYEEGRIDQPNLAAGTAIRGLLRMFFTYKGSVYWKMQAGMGDTIFTPLYEVLKRRGVKFEFFHRIDNLALSDDKKRIETIEVGIQATVKPDVIQQQGGYNPLYPVKGLPCWPSEPLYEQLVQGEALKAGKINLESAWTTWPDVDRRTLRRGQDFDLVVLGISMGGLPFVCPELAKANPKWQAMIDNVGTVQTQAFQVWLTKNTADLGWAVGQEPPVLSTYVEPLDTWADMSHLIEREDWPVTANLQNISYFCGPFMDAEHIPPPSPNANFPASQEQRAKDDALYFLRTAVQPIWPKATDPANPTGLDWSVLAASANLQGAQRFDEQFWRANIDPCERYVLSLKGSTKYRLKSGQSGFDNLYLAGDWTYNGLNAGCVEAAAMSGMFASRAISGYPVVIVGEADIMG